ncbi:hypothetical protein CTI12_AA091920 [Artemisia annua]|uniref:Protein kinase domain-containing protein n=1 Tax=Artemisia annua TaxID=35608 RepID=A0A2U1NIL0_ARTAN|nr:hypothetical protein CTI12_AA091920 [Artemisia annua]
MRLIIAQDAATGLAYLQEGKVLKMDRPMSQQHQYLLETNAYLAPEYIYTGRLSSKIDVWSYGIFLEELITGRVRTFVQENARSINVFLTQDLKESILRSQQKKVAEIAKKCLANDPKLRPNMSEVLKVVKEALELEMLNQQLPDAGKT